MVRFTLLTILMFCSVVSYGQNISVTFTGTGAVTQIDSVTATNQRTTQSVIFPGNETLVLTVNTGISSVSELTNQGIVFPNPFSGRATFTTVVQKPQTVYLNVQNLVGEVIAETQAFVQAGENLFDLYLATAGIYMVSLTTEESKSSYKIICSGATTAGNSIQYLGAGSNNHNTQNNQNNQNSPSSSALKSLNSGYTLGYTPGDIILYRCRSSIYTTIVTDTLPSSKNYEVEFAGCTDPDGKTYSIVKIGTQTWMAENLAYLPAVSPSSAASETDPYYYVYGHEGSSVDSAKATANYTTYGVLYNWPAALTACPSGWHLPTDDEWKILEKNQGMSESDANTEGYRTSGTVGSKLKESGTGHWNSPNEGANNSSGFTALPGGYRNDGGGFNLLVYLTYFWSSSEYGSNAWRRTLYFNTDGVYRYSNNRRGGFSVRCLKNETGSALIGPQGGTVQTEDGAKIEVPAGALEDTILISIVNISDSVQKINTGCRIYELKPDGLTFDQPVTIRLPYDDTYFDPNSTEINFGIAIMTKQDNEWIDLPTEIDQVNSVAITTTLHFSVFQVSNPDKFGKYFQAQKNNSSPEIVVPYYFQGQTPWCAFYSTAMIAHASGYNFQGPYYASMMNIPDDEGLPLSEVDAFGLKLDQQGISAETVQPVWKNKENLCGYIIEKLNNRLPVMVGVRYSSNPLDGHAFAVIGYNSNGFLVNDPSGDFTGRAGESGKVAVRIAYDKFMATLGTKDYYLCTLVITSKGNSSTSYGSLNFPKETVTISLINPSQTNPQGHLDFDGVKYKPNGYQIYNLETKTNSINRSWIIQTDPWLSNGSTNQKFYGILHYKIDGIDVTRRQIIIDPKYDSGFSRFKLGLGRYSNGKHIFTAELRTNDDLNLLDIWEFEFNIIGSDGDFSGNFVDPRDQHIYKTTMIGNQVWMAENLAYLPSVNPPTIGSLTEPMYYVYDYHGNDSNQAKLLNNYLNYGVLYNWSSALSACPPGWHLPTDNEWKILEISLGMTSHAADSVGWRETGNVGDKLRETGDEHWLESFGTNEVGFTALPGGFADPFQTKGFGWIGTDGCFWSFTEGIIAHSYGRMLTLYLSSVHRHYDWYWQGNGLSIRCMKN